MRKLSVLVRATAATLAAATVGVYVSAAVPALVFGASFRDFVQMATEVYLPALCLAVVTAPLAARALREDGARRLAWQCTLIGCLIVAGAELRWMMHLDLAPTPTLFWSIVFNAVLRGVPGGVAGACVVLAVLLETAPRRRALA